MKEGEDASQVYTILEGSFDILKKTPEGGRRRVASRRPGAILGEMGFLLRQPHAHDVVCADAAGCLVSQIDAKEMAELFRDSPQLMAALKDLSRKRVFRAQFGKLLPNAGKEFTQAELRQAFDLVAREKRGSAAGPDGHYITAEELREVMRGLEGWDDGEDELALLLALIDADGDGRISFAEFARAMRS